MTREVPDGLDADTTRRVLRTFLVVRIVRGSLVLLFMVIALVGVELRGWPSGLAIAITVAMVVQAGALVAWCRRYSSAGRASHRDGRP